MSPTAKRPRPKKTAPKKVKVEKMPPPKRAKVEKMPPPKRAKVEKMPPPKRAKVEKRPPPKGAKGRADAPERRRREERPVKEWMPGVEGFVRAPIEPEIEGLEGFRAGAVALVGRPNVGKSTILNQLLGQKLAATTHKPQTTRKNLLGILHPKGAQVMLLDTPGYHKAEGPLNRYMVEQSRAAIAEADVIGYVIEARSEAAITPGNEQLVELLVKSEKPIVLLVNKIDHLDDKTALLPLIQRYSEVLGEKLAAVVPISALKKQGLADAVAELAKALPVGEPVFSEDDVTNQTERAIVSEFIREKIMLETKEELPYATAVSIDAFDETDRPRITRIMATIHVEKESQKAIIIGRGGERLKTIGTRARREIEYLLSSKVFLDLNVRVTEDWSTSPQAMDMLGYGVER
ncbi:GTPase Era [Myxococcota bacterium]|nr:GTPase Era [Myxococcota bacterium]